MRTTKLTRIFYLLICVAFALTMSSCEIDDFDDPVYITGTIIDWKGTPINGATVTAKFANLNEVSTQSNVDGTYSLKLKEKGLAYVTASKEDYYSKREKIAIATNNRVIDFLLKTPNETYLRTDKSSIVFSPGSYYEYLTISSNVKFEIIADYEWFVWKITKKEGDKTTVQIAALYPPLAGSVRKSILKIVSEEAEPVNIEIYQY